MQAQDALLNLTEQDVVALDMPLMMAYQHVVGSLPTRRTKRASAALSGGYLSVHKGRGMEFDEARHYQAGDDIRAIDWRVTARTGKAHTKVFREERERPVFICCDVSATMQFGSALQLKSVLAGHLAALLSWSAKQAGDRVGGLVFNSHTHAEIKPANRTATLLHFLQQCCALQQSQPLRCEYQHQAFTEALQRLRYLAKPGALVHLISDFSQLDDTCLGLLQTLRRHCELRAYVVTDPFEHALFDSPVQLTVTDGVNIAERTFGEQQQAGATVSNSERLRPYVTAVNEFSAAEPLLTQLYAGAM
jgi:uncharacterized protein (DUF58 family)